MPVPPSDIPGEQAYPTQPIPLLPPPLNRLEITESDLLDVTPEYKAKALEEFRPFHDHTNEELNEINRSVMEAMQTGGRAFVTNAR